MSNRKRPRGRPSKYPPEFQPDAVAMVLDEGRAIAEVGRAIGVNEGTLGNFRPRVHAGEKLRRVARGPLGPLGWLASTDGRIDGESDASNRYRASPWQSQRLARNIRGGISRMQMTRD